MNIVLFLLQYCSICKCYSSLTPVHQSGHRAGELKLRKKADTNIIVCTSILLFPSWEIFAVVVLKYT